MKSRNARSLNVLELPGSASWCFQPKYDEKGIKFVKWTQHSVVPQISLPRALYCCCEPCKGEITVTSTGFDSSPVKFVTQKVKAFIGAVRLAFGINPVLHIGFIVPVYERVTGKQSCKGNMDTPLKILLFKKKSSY